MSETTGPTPDDAARSSSGCDEQHLRYTRGRADAGAPRGDLPVSGTTAHAFAVAEGVDRCTADAFRDYVEAYSPTPTGRRMTLLGHWRAWRD